PLYLEYVLVHELAHFHERGHGPRFKAVMDKFLPDWRRLRAELNGK
ncbi:MAG: M48 family metallopeptidase, partial [Alphaproteobacteria bacterium]|nr:M48 family metallopeptidase [Alphaproteobacteria bacterium]